MAKKCVDEIYAEYKKEKALLLTREISLDRIAIAKRIYPLTKLLLRTLTLISGEKIEWLRKETAESQTDKTIISDLPEELQAEVTQRIGQMNQTSSHIVEAVEKAIETRSSMGVLSDKMDTFVKYQSANAIRDAANNQGVGGLGTQLGAGMALGEMMKESMKSSNSSEQAQADAKFCPSCGASNPKNAKFCVECGGKLSQKGKCPSCGAEISGRSKFCPECGEKIK